MHIQDEAYFKIENTSRIGYSGQGITNLQPAAPNCLHRFAAASFLELTNDKHNLTISYEVVRNIYASNFHHQLIEADSRHIRKQKSCTKVFVAETNPKQIICQAPHPWISLHGTLGLSTLKG